MGPIRRLTLNLPWSFKSSDRMLKFNHPPPWLFLLSGELSCGALWKHQRFPRSSSFYSIKRIAVENFLCHCWAGNKARMFLSLGLLLRSHRHFQRSLSQRGWASIVWRFSSVQLSLSSPLFHLSANNWRTIDRSILFDLPRLISKTAWFYVEWGSSI